MKCVRCSYTSGCQRAMITHTSGCSGIYQLEEDVCDLPHEYHCVCGFVTQNGNTLTNHLVLCGRRSAYDSAEVANDNTVKRNVLDLLGLMRRDGDDVEGDGTAEEEDAAMPSEATDDTAGDSAAAAEAEPMEQDTVVEDEAAGAAAAADETVEPAADNVTEEMADDAAEAAAAVVAGEQAAPAVHHHHQFNTELSLDDLAAPASVAPPPVAGEPDRTPQLSDEYLSLATPRIAQPMENAGGEQL